MRKIFFLWACIFCFVGMSVQADLSSDTLIQRIRTNKKVLTIGILSDAQFPENDEMLSPGHWGVVMNGPKHVLRVFEYLKEKHCDLIIMNGDMVNAAHGGNAYRTYNMILDYVFGKERKAMPPLVYPMGNHEFYGDRAEECFMEQVQLPLNVHYVLDGIHFISISCSDSNGGYSSERMEYLKKHLNIACCESKDKPVIVVSHMPFETGGLWGGKWKSPQADEMYQILSAYPQVVYFSGHSHYALFDERSLVQKDFTMVNTGSTSYFDLDWSVSIDGKKLDMNKPNEYLNPHLIGIFRQADIPGRDEVNQGWMMSINTQNGKLSLQRVNYNEGVPFGSPIVLSDWSGRYFPYTVKRLQEKSRTPAFDDKASVDVLVREPGVADICFDAALKGDLVKHYEIEVDDPNGSVTILRFLAKGYYGGIDVPYKEHIRYYNCLQKGKYLLRIKAINSFGKISSLLVKEFVVQ